ncbi:hypothetical protein M422DRAFT_277082 [Sphaerobolus stellatus SS14]|uniref:Uncharacterized protein n=1 Tax=Sphaerobolus stellatus (strain SS14) TaxID=990650 RepID=A0A0C9UBJ9_SPHS4|nr:hypothetical protein M422DRAFT_277082 [Sphaerobolus stellatus SS14]
MEIRAAGIGTDGKPHYFMERYKPIHDGKMLDYADIPEALVYDEALQNHVAGTHEVCREDVYVVPPWKPQVFKSLPKVVSLRLVDMIDLDEQMQVQSGHEELKLAVQSYIEQTYALVHIGCNRRAKVPKPNWDRIGEAEGDCKCRPSLCGTQDREREDNNRIGEIRAINDMTRMSH